MNAAHSAIWFDAALDALTDYQRREGHRPSEAVLSTSAARDLAASTGQHAYFLGYPVCIDNAIDGIYFR